MEGVRGVWRQRQRWGPYLRLHPLLSLEKEPRSGGRERRWLHGGESAQTRSGRKRGARPSQAQTPGQRLVSCQSRVTRGPRGSWPED